MVISIGEEADVVIIGNGPSALILSYILSGNTPYYSGKHEDRILDRALSASPDLLHVAPTTYEHIHNAMGYSSQALPINALLDTLLRPNGDIGSNEKTCVKWRYEPGRAVRHIILGNAPCAGGQWADNPVKASWHIGSLSYAEQLSLPGYSFAEHWQFVNHEPLPDFTRPTREDYADYLRHYPEAVGISKNMRHSQNVTSVTRRRSGFHIAPQDISCRHVVLATGIFSIRLPPPRSLAPLTSLPPTRPDGSILVIGSGFTAADIIISSPAGRKIIHVFKWDPVDRLSPLKACHASAYPEYAWIYRQMRLAAEKGPFSRSAGGTASEWTPRAQMRRTPQSAARGFTQRNWQSGYEGFANARVFSVSASPSSPSEGIVSNDGAGAERATIELGRSSCGSHLTRTITSFHYAVGRRSSLAYLSPPLQAEVLVDHGTNGHAAKDMDPDASTVPGLVSGASLRPEIEARASEGGVAAGLGVADGVWAVGSLTGDSLVRFAYGGCCAVAGAIEDASRQPKSGREFDPVDEVLKQDWKRLEKDWWIWA